MDFLVRRETSHEQDIQGVQLALGPFRHPKPGMAPFLVPFSVGMGPFVRSGDRNFDAGVRFRVFFFFGLSPPFSGTQWIDQQCMLFDTSSLKNVLLT